LYYSNCIICNSYCFVFVVWLLVLKIKFLINSNCYDSIIWSIEIRRGNNNVLKVTLSYKKDELIFETTSSNNLGFIHRLIILISKANFKLYLIEKLKKPNWESFHHLQVYAVFLDLEWLITYCLLYFRIFLYTAWTIKHHSYWIIVCRKSSKYPYVSLNWTETQQALIKHATCNFLI